MLPISISNAISGLCRSFLKPQRKILVLCSLATFNLSYAQIAAKWTFETSVPTTAGPITPEIGSGAANCYHASPTATYSNPSGNGSAESYSSNNWAAGEYYQFYTSTTGLTNVGFAFDQTSTSTGPESLIIQLSTNGTTYTTLAGSNYDVAADNWTSGASNYLTSSHHYFSIPQLDNQPNVYIRIAVATGSTAVNGSAIGGGGTTRVDNVIIGTATALPLSIKSFTVIKSASGNLLQWKTAMEKDLDYFSIEKSPDGKLFEEIDRLNATNNVLGNDYQLLDNEIGRNVYYRFRIIDKSGVSTLSNVIYINGTGYKPSVTCLYNVLSNNCPLLIHVNDGNLYYCIINSEGRTLFSGRNTEDGIRTVQINFSEIAAGLYFLKTSLNGTQQTFKILKQ